MAAKTANVTARVEPDIKEQAEAIMEQMGVSVSTAINMFYRQIIVQNGLPFRPTASVKVPKAYDEMTKEEFDAKMAIGYKQAINDESIPVDEAFEKLIGEIENAGI